ncbi:unnamed protein product, partial [Amoebophrya sp. A120]
SREVIGTLIVWAVGSNIHLLAAISVCVFELRKLCPFHDDLSASRVTKTCDGTVASAFRAIK